MDLCIRIWDNILAYGTRFLFNITLALLELLQDRLLTLDMCQIDEFFKLLKDDDHAEEKQLPPCELIIDTAQKIDIPKDELDDLLKRHEPKPV